MKKLFIMFFLSFTIFLISGCERDLDSKYKDPVDNEDIVDINEDIDQGEIIDNDQEKPIIDSKKQETFIYENKEYAFTLKIPLWWEESYKVEEGLWMDETSKSIAFNFDKEDISSNIFTIIILNETIKEDQWEDPLLTYLLEKDGKTYFYLPSMEPSEELLKAENKEHLNFVSNMVEEVPEIIQTFNIVK